MPAFNQQVADILWYCQWALLVAVLAGEWLCAQLGLPTPSWLLLKNNWMVVAGLFLGCSMLSQSMLSSGAFEVTYNGHMIFSKMKMGDFPQAPDVIAALKEVMAASA